MKTRKILKNEAKITCIRCNYSWIYTGQLAPKSKVKNRCRCPRCHSSQNNLNREIFGRFIGL